jgi:hypothetical protein
MTQSTPKKRRPFAQWRSEFIEALREFGVVSYAAECAGIERTAAYAARKRNAKFSDEWDEALAEATDKLELEARRRAADGVQRLKFHKGVPIMVPFVDTNGIPVYEDARDAEGNIIFDKRGEPKQQLVMVPYVEHEYSDTLLIFLLKNWNKEKYGDQMQLSTKDGKPLVSHQQTILFANATDDELFDLISSAMGQLAAPPERKNDSGRAGTGTPTAGTDAGTAESGEGG